MNDAQEIRRKRLLYQSGHRGTKESDLLLGAFALAHVRSFTAAELDQFEAILDESDPDLMDWLTGRTLPPPEKMTGVLRRLLDFRYPGPS
jgi:antitoxin CptB